MNKTWTQHTPEKSCWRELWTKNCNKNQQRWIVTKYMELYDLWTHWNSGPCWYRCFYLGKNKVKLIKLATLVEGDLKAPFSIATTPRCRGECYSIPWIAPLYPNLIVLSTKQGSIFWDFGMTQPGIEFQSLRPLTNTLLIRPMARYRKEQDNSN